MFEETLDYLVRDYHTLLDRMNKGKKLIEELPEKSGEQYNSYVNQYNYLKVMVMRAYTCIDILNGDVVLIAEQGGSLVAARRVDNKAKALIDEAQKFGSFITELDIVKRR